MLAKKPAFSSHFVSKPGEPELPDTSDSDNQRPPGRLISIKMVRQHFYRTLPSAARKLERNGHRAQEMAQMGGLGSVEYCDAEGQKKSSG